MAVITYKKQRLLKKKNANIHQHGDLKAMAKMLTS